MKRNLRVKLRARIAGRLASGDVFQKLRVPRNNRREFILLECVTRPPVDPKLRHQRARRLRDFRQFKRSGFYAEMPRADVEASSADDLAVPPERQIRRATADVEMQKIRIRIRARERQAASHERDPG